MKLDLEMQRKTFLAGLAGIFATLPGQAVAQTDAQPRWHGRIAAARIMFDEDAKVMLGGQPLTGANATAQDNNGISLQLGYFLTPNLSVNANVGIPLTTKLTAAGTLAGAGTLGKVTYGPGLYSLRYHLGRPGGIRPYVGAGLNWTLIFETKDGVLQDFKASNTTGPTVLGGIEIPINRRFSLYGEASKVWTSTNARFRLASPNGLVPGTARVQLDPLIVQAGLQARF